MADTSLVQKYPFDGFEWEVEVVDRIDVEFVLEHLMEEFLFYARAGVQNPNGPVGRDVKNVLIRSNQVI